MSQRKDHVRVKRQMWEDTRQAITDAMHEIVRANKATQTTETEPELPGGGLQKKQDLGTAVVAANAVITAKLNIVFTELEDR